MAGPQRSVWVEVSTELLAELGDWSEPGLPPGFIIRDRRP